ncbi:hypothetical protein BBW65_04410 [Helicobacter enhydrae]|uniref:DUF342 domain-containing protein n=1 Tax=Helicobacter enhydrae TaxID=222136 RepID=A0A1B1U5Q9_9HELI|nr:hypothetical protein [Helicobacter enhydrae]ANV98088.1 hypothetical protein BBW65_04410 [Helicobacter enhydrae]
MKELEIKISKTLDIVRELEKASILHQIDVKKLTFEILEVYTFLEEDGVKRELTAQQAQDFFHSKEYEESESRVFQAYDILIQKISPEEEELQIELRLEREKSQLFLICHQDVLAKFREHLGLLHKKINAEKGILRIIFEDFSLGFNNATLQKMIKSATDAYGGYRKILLAQSAFYRPVRDAEFVFILKDRWEFENQTSLENSSFAAKENEEVGRLYCVDDGSRGRNLLGEMVRPEKRETIPISFSILEEDFTIKEDKEFISYIANKEGYVGMNNSGLFLIKELNLGEANHRNIGNLLGGLESNLCISIIYDNEQKDAVGAGMVLEAQKIEIKGSVDQGVVLRAKECNIQGAIHQGAEVYADVAQLGNHKGKFEGDRVIIKSLEGGVVFCEDGEFGDVIGGEVYGKTINIARLHANAKICISNHLKIGEMIAGDNCLRVDSSAFWKYQKDIDAILLKCQKYQDKIDVLEGMYKAGLLKARKIKPMVDQFRVIYAQNNQKGIKTQDYILNTMSEYLKLSNRIKAIRTKIQQLQQEKSAVKKELEPIADLTLGARIECEGHWTSQNQVEYINVAREIKESMVIDEGERVSILIDPQKMKITKTRR